MVFLTNFSGIIGVNYLEEYLSKLSYLVMMGER